MLVTQEGTRFRIETDGVLDFREMQSLVPTTGRSGRYYCPVTPFTSVKLGMNNDLIEIAKTQKYFPRSIESVIGKTIPYTFKTHPWPHQHVSTKFLLACCENTGGCGLWLEMGCGKTKVVIDALETMHKQWKKILVICPKIAIGVWEEEVETHGITLPLWFEHEFNSMKVTHRACYLRDDIMPQDRFMVAVNYDVVWMEGLEEILLKIPWDIIIFDEVHRVKSSGSLAHKTCFKLAKKVPRRVGMSGTPFSQSILDAYGVYRVLDCGIMHPSLHRFRTEHAVQKDIPTCPVPIIVGTKNHASLKKRTDLIGIHFATDDVCDIPEAKEQIFHVKMIGRVLYEKLKKDFIADIKSGVIVAANAAVKASKLLQLCQGFAYIDGAGHKLDKQLKIEATLDILEDIDSPFLIISQFTFELEMLAEKLKKRDRKFFRVMQGKDEHRAWRDEGGVCIAQVDSIKEAIDATHCHHHLYLSCGYKLGAYTQSLRRTRRPGQAHSVTYYYLLTKDHLMDYHVYNALRNDMEPIAAMLRDIGENKIEF